MGQAWIEDEDRPGGVGRSERERVFWERVASGRVRTRSNVERKSQRLGATGGWAESLEMAIVTLLTVVVFGLGWATLETGNRTFETKPGVAGALPETR